MSLPSANANGQPSIRNFFKPKQPTYALPPSATLRQPISPPPPPPPPPPSAAVTAGSAGPSPSPSPNENYRSPTLHPQATTSPVLPEHVTALRRITSLLLPVNYPDSFYAGLSNPLSSGAFSRVLLWEEPNSAPKVIGGLVCRPEPSPFRTPPTAAQSSPLTPDSQPNALYIQSLVLLSPYRGLGLAAELLDEVVKTAVHSQFRCETVYAHVWTENEEGLRWYLARGFVKTDEVKSYYHKLRPDSAWIVRRDISGPGTALGLGNNGQGTPTATVALSVTTAVANLPKTAPAPPVVSPTSILSEPPRGSPGSGNGPPPNRSPNSGHGLSFQNARPDMEWNDLPADMHTPRNLTVPSDGVNSSTSSRSSSAVRKKKDRAYPAAAFGK
ncbi:hypothetical protein F4778DRAFT_754296 [Xylariomycetidae sp. FL2044]|nr:hypothetical protein F4778DRAFT_754296 [Xylariomycetidae sp. FL2044]